MSETLSPLSGPTAAKIDAFTDRATAQADEALAATRRAANGALDKLQQGVEQLRDDTPGALRRAAAQVDELTRRGLERARLASEDLRHTVSRTGDRSIGFIQAQPVKSVLIAAAAGAALAALVGALARDRRSDR